MCSKPNVVTTLRRLKIGNITLIKCSKGFVACLVLPYLVEKRHKPLVLLTIDGLQFYGEIACLLQRLARKKERSVVILAQHTFLMFCHYGSQLLQVAYHEQLNAAKGQIVLTITAHHRVDGIKQVAAHHTDLVDDQEIHRTNDVSLHLAELKPLLLTTSECSTRKIRRKGQLKEGMNGHTTGIDGSDSCRSQDHHTLWRPALEFLQEGCLSSLTCKKQIGTRLLYNVPGFQGLLVHFHLAVYF